MKTEPPAQALDPSEPVVYVNGEFVPQSQARISVLDHAVLYGDGVFETAFAWRGRVFKLDAHIERGFRSMAAIALRPPVDRAEMRRLILETVSRNRLRDAYVKWLITRGTNGKPLMDPTGCVPNLIILAQPYISRVSQERAAEGLRLKTVALRRPPGQVLDPQIKSLNYLNLVLAKLEAKAAGADEALLLDLSGRICEATGCNVFTVHGARLRTPRHDILAGITRETVLELASDVGLVAEQCDIELYDAYTADEVFICSTAGGLLPVVEIDGRVIGSGNPGPVFHALRAAYEALISSPLHGTDIPPHEARGLRESSHRNDNGRGLRS
jgi:branched-chain amino acid aminotransferase